METFRRNLPVRLLCLEKETELSTFFDLGWSSAQIKGSQGAALKKGCLNVPTGKVHSPQMTEAIAFLPCEIISPRKGHFPCFSPECRQLCTWESHSDWTACFPFLVVKETAISGTQ